MTTNNNLVSVRRHITPQSYRSYSGWEEAVVNAAHPDTDGSQGDAVNMKMKTNL